MSNELLYFLLFPYPPQSLYNMLDGTVMHGQKKKAKKNKYEASKKRRKEKKSSLSLNRDFNVQQAQRSSQPRDAHTVDVGAVATDIQYDGVATSHGNSEGDERGGLHP